MYPFQTLDLSDAQLDWVTNHLGHTMDVHKINYRLTSSDIERTQVAKMLLLQDHAQVGKFRDKTLAEIDLKGKYAHMFNYQ